jgi:ssDNA-binding Zn-finger/Zn-ribbon topoisomerase 1
MSEVQPLKELLERLTSVESKLEKLLNSQLVIRREGLAKSLHKPDFGGSSEIEPDAEEDADILDAAFPPNPFRSSPAISPLEADTILQKVQKINRDTELMERVLRLEKQNRKINILSAMCMTAVVLIFVVFSILMVQANFFYGGVILPTSQKVDPAKPSSGKEAAKVKDPPPAEPIAKVNVPPAAESVAPLNAAKPKEAAGPSTDPKTAKASAPVVYVGSITSNKYHYPDCKWAAKIKPYKLRIFHSVKEARQKGYIPCPTCRPPRADGE